MLYNVIQYNMGQKVLYILRNLLNIFIIGHNSLHLLQLCTINVVFDLIKIPTHQLTTCYQPNPHIIMLFTYQQKNVYVQQFTLIHVHGIHSLLHLFTNLWMNEFEKRNHIPSTLSINLYYHHKANLHYTDFVLYLHEASNPQ